MGPTEDRNQAQIYFCCECNGPGVARHSATGRRYCVPCAAKLPPIKPRNAKPEPRMRQGRIGVCAICDRQLFLTQHHSKPKADGKPKEGPIWKLCFPCHRSLHVMFRNRTLRVMTIAEARNAILKK